MNLRKSLIAGAAVVAAGLLSITSAASAEMLGTDINAVTVDGATSGAQPIDGVFESGTASFGGGTFGCIGGTVSGTADAGATPPSKIAHMDFDTLDIECETPIGINAIISIGNDCATGAFQDSDVNDGKVDTAVDGTVTLATNCGTVTAGPCTANVQGSVAASYDEVTQKLILNGPGFTLSNQSFACLGLLDGGVTLNDITFAMDASGGGVDFRSTP